MKWFPAKYISPFRYGLIAGLQSQLDGHSYNVTVGPTTIVIDDAAKQFFGFDIGTGEAQLWLLGIVAVLTLAGLLLLRQLAKSNL